MKMLATGAAVVIVSVVAIASAVGQPAYVLKAWCEGGARGGRTEVIAQVDGTIQQRSGHIGDQSKDWQKVGRDQKRVRAWLRQVEGARLVRADRVEDKYPCPGAGRSDRMCYLVRHMKGTDHYVCQREAVQRAMMEQ